MTDDQKAALEQLERRVATLENLVRRLTFAATAEPRAAPPLPPVPPAAAPVAKATQRTDLEQWFGQRGLLAVGVAALLLAAAFFLKYAFDRGWIPPLLRSISAVIAGIAIAGWGHERIGRGMRRYGAAMIGAGGGLVYLGLWAAAGPYALMDRRTGILLLAATTVGVTLLALHHEIEALAIWALGGAYLAPLILQTAPNPQGFLAYLEVIGLGTAITAYAMAWRATYNLALFGYLLLAALGAAPAISTPLGCWLIAAGAILTLHVSRLRAWPETRVGVPLIAWAMLGTGLAGLSGGETARWSAVAAPVLLWGLLWWQQVERDPFRVAAGGGEAQKIEEVALERFLFVASPIALLLLVNAAAPRMIQGQFGVVPTTLAVAYLPVGWFRRSAAHLIMAFLLVALAMVFPWQAATIVIGWIALALVALLVERAAARPGGRYTALTLAVLGWACLFTAALIERSIVRRSEIFAGRWALALYLYVVGSAALARRWGREDKLRVVLWILCGAAVFAGGSVLFADYFGRITGLAGDLALSVWWLLFAGALVFIGFRLNLKLARSTGLAVAAGTGLKIVVYDLSNLQALYRVASFFALALIALAVAYAYNRRAKASAA